MASARHDEPERLGDPSDIGAGDRLTPVETFPPAFAGLALDFMIRRHRRLRRAAEIIAFVADGGFDRRRVGELIAFLEVDLGRHEADNEGAVFPALLLHCLPEDGIDALIERLAEDHKRAERGRDEVVRLVKSRLAGAELAPESAARLRSFSRHVRQQIALEDAILIPIARVRLDGDALRLLGLKLKARQAVGKIQR